MDLQTMRSRVQGYLGGRTDATNTLVDEALNNTYRDYCISFFPDALEETDETLTTVDGTHVYAVPSSLYTVVGVRDKTNDLALTQKEIDWFDTLDLDDEGEPEYFVVYGDQVLLFPVPDGAYELLLRGPALPTALAQNTDSPVLPLDWHPIMILQAASDLAFYFGMDARGMILKNEALSKISTKQEKRTIRRRRTFGRINPGKRGLNG